MVTDVTLQVQDENHSGFPKTLPVCVTPSCVLGQEVLEELAKAAPHSFFFRDALRDQGMLLSHSREPVVTYRVQTLALGLPGPALELLGTTEPSADKACGVQRPPVPPRRSLAMPRLPGQNQSPLHYGQTLSEVPVVTLGLSVGGKLYRCKSHFKPLPETFFKTNEKPQIVNMYT